MPLACFQCADTLLSAAKHAKGMSLRYGVVSLQPINHNFRGFSPCNGERFLSLGQCGEPSGEGGGGIVWLAAWKLVSNDAKRTVAPPNVKHSTLPQGCFLCFCF